ncbi:glycosyltransferase family 9 protein [Candidatus Nitrospira bockiana]
MATRVHASEPGLLNRLPVAATRVAVFRASRLGDYLCATPALRALRAALPAAEITVIALPWVAELARRSALMDRVESFPGYPGIAEQWFRAADALAFFARMQDRRFDLAIQMHGTGVYANPVTLMLGARMTAGLIRPGDPPGRLDAAFPMPSGVHQARRLLAFMAFLGAPSQDLTLDFPLGLDEALAADRLLTDADPPFIGLHAGTWDDAKRWPAERFAEAGSELQRRHGGTIVLLGGERERAVGERLNQSVRGACRNLIGRTSLGVLGGVIARLHVLLTNDSGPAHIAYALGTPSVTIFGSTDPVDWGPLNGGPHRTLAHLVPDARCPIGNVCLLAVSADEVVAEAEAVMRASDGTGHPDGGRGRPSGPSRRSAHTTTHTQGL